MTTHIYDPATFAKLAPTLQPGDVVKVSGDLTQKITGVKVPAGAPPIVFEAEPGARMGGWGLISDCAGVTFRGFALLTAQPSAKAATTSFSVSGERITLEDITVRGAGAHGAGGTAVIVTGGSVVLRRWTVRDVCTFGSMQGVSDVVIEDLDVEGYWADGLQVALKGGSCELNRVTFRRCTGGYAHRDAVQMMMGAYRFKARGVLVDCSEGTPVQGFFSDNAPDVVMDIQSCALFGVQWNGINTSDAGPAPGSLIDDNFLQGFAEPFAPVGKVMKPYISAPGWCLGKRNVIAPLTVGRDRSALTAWLARNADPRETRIRDLEAQLAAIQSELAQARDDARGAMVLAEDRLTRLLEAERRLDAVKVALAAEQMKGPSSA